jgi:hypothetical protein
MTVPTALDAAGRRRSPATVPGYHAGRPHRNKGQLYPADPPTVEEIIGGDAPSSRRSPRRPPAGADRRALARRAARPGGARDWRARARFAPRVATRSPRQGWPCCARASALWLRPREPTSPIRRSRTGVWPSGAAHGPRRGYGSLTRSRRRRRRRRSRGRGWRPAMSSMRRARSRRMSAAPPGPVARGRRECCTSRDPALLRRVCISGAG